MALTKSILKMTETETVVKVAGAGGTATIDLQTDLVDVNQSFTGVTSAEILTAQDTYEGNLAVLQDAFSQLSGQPGYPWGITLPVSYLTYNQIIVLPPGRITGPGAASIPPLAVAVKNSWSAWQDLALTKVTITAVRWSGDLSNTIAVTRNSTRVLTLPTESADYIAFDGQELPPENTESESDIVVAQTGTGQIELYLKLRKVSGYAPKVETTQFSVYDDTNTVGS
jgi:hypothetical protein